MIDVEKEIINESYFILNSLEELILTLLEDKEIKNTIKDMVLKYSKNVPPNIGSRFFLDLFFNTILGAEELKIYGVKLDDKNIRIEFKINKLREEIIKIIEENKYRDNNNNKRNKKLKIIVSILLNSIYLMNCVRVLLRMFVGVSNGYKYYLHVENQIKYILLTKNKHLFAYVCNSIDQEQLLDDEEVILYLIESGLLILNLIKNLNLNINKNSIKKKEEELLTSLEILYDIMFCWVKNKISFNVLRKEIEKDIIKKKEEVSIFIF